MQPDESVFTPKARLIGSMRFGLAECISRWPCMQPVRVDRALTWLPGCQITGLSEIEGLVSSTETCMMVTVCICVLYRRILCICTVVRFAFRSSLLCLVCVTCTLLGYLVSISYTAARMLCSIHIKLEFSILQTVYVMRVLAVLR
ncbi:hypothetical protein GGI35DRAFT_371005 [Trichoderma velutinum]